MYSKPSAPRSIGGVLGDGFRLGRAAFAKTWSLALAAQLLVAVPIVVLKAQFGANLGSEQSNMILLQSPKFALAYVALALFSAGFQNAITVQNASVAQNAPKTLGESLSIGFRLLPRTLLFGLLMVAGFFLIAVCFVIPAFFVSQQGRVLLALLFLVPLCFYLGRIFLANVIFVVEDAPAYVSLQRSWDLTQHNYWRTSAILSLLVLILIGALLLAGLLGTLVAAVVGNSAMALSLTLVQLLSAAANMLFTPFISAVLLAIYYDLRLRKEDGVLPRGSVLHE